VPEEMKQTFPILAFAILLAGCSTPQQPPVQPVAEILDFIGETTQHWVLARVIRNSAPPEIICVDEASFSLALIVEHELDGTPDLPQAISNLVVVGVASGFRFTKQEALECIPPPCSSELLGVMRQALSGYLDEDLTSHDFLASPLDLPGYRMTDSNEDERIFAQALIERGLRPYIGCFSGQFGIRKAKE